MKSSLADTYPTAFVTGASAGLGRAFAEMLLLEGVRVWGTARETGRLEDLRAAHASSFVPVALDLAQGPAAAQACERAAAEAGVTGFDLVVANAGYGVFGDFAAVDFSVWEAQFDSMLGTVARLSHSAFRSMLARNRGCLVHISSLAAEFPLPFMSGYNVVKAGLSALSESLIFEARGSGVVVIDFRPGDYRTAFNRGMETASSIAPAVRAMPRKHELAWKALEANLNGAPPPSRAAVDLRSALLRGRSGVVRSGSFFQARLAPFVAGLTPASFMREASARYFGSK